MKTIVRMALLGMVLIPFGLAAEETPQTMAMEVRIGSYTPDIDSEFGPQDEKPFDKIFGGDSALMLGLELDSQVWHGFGSAGLFGIVSYGYVSGKGIAAGGTKSSDDTTMSFLPLTAGVVYRFDVAAVNLGIPIVPVVKGGLSYTVWWIRDGVEDIAGYVPPSGTGAAAGSSGDGSGKSVEGTGGTFGFYGSVGVHVLLDFFEPHTAKVFDNDLGVNNSYLFAEVAMQRVDDFGSDKSFDLSDTGLFFGLAFEM